MNLDETWTGLSLADETRSGTALEVAVKHNEASTEGVIKSRKLRKGNAKVACKAHDLNVVFVSRTSRSGFGVPIGNRGADLPPRLANV